MVQGNLGKIAKVRTDEQAGTMDAQSWERVTNSLDNFRQLAADNPSVLVHQTNYVKQLIEVTSAICHQLRAETPDHEGLDLADAQLKIAQPRISQLLASHEASRELITSLANFLRTRAEVEALRGNIDRCKADLHQSLEIIDKLLDDQPNDWSLLDIQFNTLMMLRDQEPLGSQGRLSAQNLLVDLLRRRLVLSVGQGDVQIQEFERTRLSNLLWNASDEFRRQGDLPNALRMTDIRLELWPERSWELYYAAEELARSLLLLGPEESNERGLLEKKIVRVLQKAMSLGDSEEIKSSVHGSSSFDSVRELAAFRKLLGD